MLNINILYNYLNKTLGELKEVRPLHETEVAALPLYIRKSYNFYHAAILGMQVIFAEKPSQENMHMQLKKEYQLLYRAFNEPVVFLFENITAYQRMRMLELKIPFVIPSKQLYLPFIALDFTESKEVVKKERNKLTPASQCLLLFHLQVEKISHQNFQHISGRLPYTQMTISRAAKELEGFGLAKIIMGSKDRYLLFEQRPVDLFKSALDYLTTPIKIDFFLDRIPQGYHLFKTYDEALAEYSDLAPGAKVAYAIGPADFQKLKTEMKGNFDYFEGNIRMERWTYPPDALSKTDIVDPLSLYLSMREEKDERVNMALDQLLKKVKW